MPSTSESWMKSSLLLISPSALTSTLWHHVTGYSFRVQISSTMSSAPVIFGIYSEGTISARSGKEPILTSELNNGHSNNSS
ncbi:hypothetical protein CPB84DRAFT_1785761, partial [Gymnopilus junonius]